MSNSRERGRPVDEEKHAQQRGKLLAAAKDLLEIKSYNSVTIRELAERAGVNSAMISYYFNNKQGLFIALVDEMSEQMFNNFKAMSKTDDPIRSFIEMMIKVLTTSKGFARLIHDEVMSTDSDFRDIFIERFPKRMANLLPNMIIQNTAITDMTKAKYSAFSLMMLLITPFIHEPVRKHAWDISDEELMDPTWAEHVYTLFISGCSMENTAC